MTISGIFLSGTTEEGVPYYQQVFDTRVQIAVPFVSKEALERAQLEKYRLDHLLHFGSIPFENVERGGEPPDFIVQQNQVDWKIDCAALALQSRRHAEALFNRLTQRLAERESGAWTNLASCEAFIQFNSSTQLPPSKNDTSLDAEIETALASIIINHERLAQFSAEVAQNGFPSQWPSDVIIPTFQHEHFLLVVNSVSNWQPRDQLSEKLGFYLNLQYPIALHEVLSEVKSPPAEPEAYHC
jgi:hypothetical protein